MAELKLKTGESVFVNDDIYEELKTYSLFIKSNGYVTAYSDGKSIEIHKFIMDDKNFIVDHKDGNKLNNLRENLRYCNYSQNNANRKKIYGRTSIYKGTTKIGENKWKVSVTKKSIGNFLNEIAAANAYNYYAEKEFGEFAKVNDVPYMTKEEWEKFKTSPSSSSKYKGVYKRKERWVSKIIIDRSNIIHVGTFSTEFKAVIAYNEKCKELELFDKIQEIKY